MSKHRAKYEEDLRKIWQRLSLLVHVIVYNLHAATPFFGVAALVIDMEMEIMLCVSGGLGGNADEPALAPGLDEELDIDLGEDLDLGW